MKYYTVWYIEFGIKKVWVTGLTLEEAKPPLMLSKMSSALRPEWMRNNGNSY